MTQTDYYVHDRAYIGDSDYSRDSLGTTEGIRYAQVFGPSASQQRSAQILFQCLAGCQTQRV